ncbi:MAG: CapA family protein [Beduini sp.]
MNSKRKLKILKRTTFVLSLNVIVLSVLAFSLKTQQHPTFEDDTLEVLTPTLPQEEIKRDEIKTIKISAAGDFTLGTDENFSYASSFNAKYKSAGPDHFLKNVKDVFNQDDLTLANLEGTLTKETARQDKQFAFKGEPEYASLLSNASIEAVNLANNHTYDYGQKSYQDTIQNVENVGVKTFGYERNYIYEINGIKVGLIGTNALGNPLNKQQEILNNIKKVKEEGANLIVISIHWGIERDQYPMKEQIQLAHTLIDEGADLILGTHPHVLQGIEKYNGKNIVYSLGNFCYGGHSGPADKDTMIFQQTFTFVNDNLQLDDNTNVIPCSISSVSGYNDYAPTISSDLEKDRITEKIRKLSEKF